MKKNIIRFNKVIYSKNINQSLYFFFLKKEFRLIKYLPLRLLVSILFMLHLYNEQNYMKIQYKYLKDIISLDNKLVIYWAKHKHQLNRMIMKRNHRYDLIVDNAPSIIFSPILSEYLIDIHIGNIYDVTNNKFINYKSIKQQWLFAVKEQSVVNGFDYYNSRLLANCNNKFIVPNDKRIRKLDIHYYLRFIVEVLFTIAMFIFVSAILTYISLINACPNLDPQVIVTYFMSMELLLLNYMPVIVLMLMVYLLSGRPYIAYGFTCAVVLITTIINKTKLQLRDDPFVFADVALVNESIEMTKKYTVYVTLFQVICVLLFIGFGYILYKRCRKDQLSIYLRIPLIIILGMFAFDSYNEYYLDNKLYARLGDKESIAVFSDSQQYQVRGFIYPFVRSIDQAIPRPPSNYNEKEAAEILDKFEFKDIEDNRKVNVVTIMLESYTDLRPNSTVEFNPETYAFLDNIYEESYHGNLVDNVFAGGTISTERNVINTFSNSSNLNSNVNSVAWYFKQQGYTTEAMHPCLGWFYNRKNGNRFLGYDKFLYEENAFNKDPNYVRYDDGTFFPYIKEGYNNAIKSNKKYFNFSVTYQNHGPYAGHDTADDEYIINDDSYEQLPYVITNNYLSGIKHTNDELTKLIDYFRTQKEPTVVILFGDHRPLLGDDFSGYNFLGQKTDESIEGMKTRYTTPYIIWGNASAQDTLNVSFKGQGSDISPTLLMPTAFKVMNYQGDQFMQYEQDFMKNIDVIHKEYYKENGKYVKTLSAEGAKKLDERTKLEYYQSFNFNDKYEGIKTSYDEFQ